MSGTPLSFSPPVFLVIDDQEDNRQLLCQVLLRKFPKNTIFECVDSDEAAAIIHKTPITACVVHKASDADCLPLLEKIRSLTARPILSICGTCDEKQARQCGADAYVHFDAWLRVGAVMDDLLSRKK